MRKALWGIVIVCLAGPPALAGNNTVVEEIIARVNDHIISRSDLERSKEQLKQEIQQPTPPNPDKEYAEREKDVLRDLIDQQLLLGRGQDLGITADTQLVKKLDELRKQMNLDTMEDLEKAAQQQGVSYEDFKQNMRNNIITQEVISREVGAHISITKEEEQQFYDEHKAELERPEQVRLSEILVSTQKPAEGGGNSSASAPTETQLAQAQQKADRLLNDIRKGARFEEIAKRNSDGPTAAQGGDLGPFKRGTLAKELEDITFAMKPGDVSNVIRTKQGWVILRVTEHQKAGMPSLKEVEPRIQDALYMRKLQPALRAYLTKLRDDAFIDIKPGYVDTAASPNETKPVITTAELDKPKKKKKKHFLLF